MPNPKQTPEEIALNEAIKEVYIYRSKLLSDFPANKQQQIADAYRFSATRYNSNETVYVPITQDTLDIL